MLISQESAELIAGEISAIMHKPAFLADETAAIIASSLLSQVGKPHSGAREVIEKGLGHHIMPSEDRPGAVEICFPIITNDHRMGAVGIIDDSGNTEDIIAYYSDVIRRIAEVRIQRLSRRMSHDEEQRYFDHARQIFFESTLFSDTLSDYLNDDEVIFRASLLGIDLEKPRIIVVLGFETDCSRVAEGAVTQALSPKNLNDFAQYLKRHITFHDQNFCFADGQRVVILFCSSSIERVQEKTARLCEDLERFYAVKIYGGISTVAEKSIHFKRCYSEAKTACLMAQRTQKKMLVSYDVASPYFIAQSLDADVRKILVKTVFSRTSDGERQEMARIIKTYCDCGGSVENAALRIFMHRNTFLYRINKIRAVTGYDMKDPRDLCILYLAVLSL